MKIKKFNENLDQSKNYYMCIIISSIGPQIDNSGIFETQEDMDNWILNYANELLSNDNLEEDNWEIGKDGIYVNEEGYPVFINVEDAINWVQEKNSCDFQYDSSVIYSDVKLEYGVDTARAANKYNLL